MLQAEYRHISLRFKETAIPFQNEQQGNICHIAQR